MVISIYPGYDLNKVQHLIVIFQLRKKGKVPFKKYLIYIINLCTIYIHTHTLKYKISVQYNNRRETNMEIITIKRKTAFLYKW